jgi:hypothetical protein
MVVVEYGGVEVGGLSFSRRGIKATVGLGKAEQNRPPSLRHQRTSSILLYSTVCDGTKRN